MPKQRKAKQIQPRAKKRQINWLQVLYVVIAAVMVFSLVAGIFSGVTLPADQTGVAPGQTTARDTGERVPITVVPSSPDTTPTLGTP